MFACRVVLGAALSPFRAQLIAAVMIDLLLLGVSPMYRQQLVDESASRNCPFSAVTVQWVLWAGVSTAALLPTTTALGVFLGSKVGLLFMFVYV